MNAHEIALCREEIRALSRKIDALTKMVESLVIHNPDVPIPGKRCTMHNDCHGGGMFCNDGGPKWESNEDD